MVQYPQFAYVGPEEIRVKAVGAPGLRIADKSALLEWLKSTEAREEDFWATYVVSASQDFLVAARRSEHVTCASGNDVLGAGEVQFDEEGTVRELTNYSTGYCPDYSSIHAICAALDSVGIGHPGDFTEFFLFRRCPDCQERNLVKDGWFSCALCEADLPRDWNF